MKKHSQVACVIAMLMLFSTVFAQETKVKRVPDDGKTYVCVGELKPFTAEKVPLKYATKKVVKAKAKSNDVEPNKLKPSTKEKKNTILIEPMFSLGYSRGYRESVYVPGIGLSYIRDITPTFGLGFGLSYQHAFYTKSFNLYGGKLIFAVKF